MPSASDEGDVRAVTPVFGEQDSPDKGGVGPGEGCCWTLQPVNTLVRQKPGWGFVRLRRLRRRDAQPECHDDSSHVDKAASPLFDSPAIRRGGESQPERVARKRMTRPDARMLPAWTAYAAGRLPLSSRRTSLEVMRIPFRPSSAALALPLIASILGAQQGATPASRSPFQHLLADHWQWSLRESPILATTLGEHRYDRELYDPSIAAMDRRAREAAAFLARADAIDTTRLTSGERVSRAILRRDLAPDVAREANRMMRDSIQYALDHRREALDYALQFARDMDPALQDKFVGMYVNHYTVDSGDVIPKAAQKLLDLGYEAGLIPNKVTVDFVR